MFDLACDYDLVEQSPVRPKLHRPEGGSVEKPTLDPDQIRGVLARLPAQPKISTTSDIYVHPGDDVIAEGTEMLAELILGNCDLFVTQNSEMVS